MPGADPAETLKDNKQQSFPYFPNNYPGNFKDF